jgi:hypothetical protein
VAHGRDHLHQPIDQLGDAELQLPKIVVAGWRDPRGLEVAGERAIDGSAQ